jgi:pilus assembly protein CpaF
MMALIGATNITEELIRRQVISALDIIVQQRRFDDGSRKITHICEVTKLKSDEYKLNDLFFFDENKREFIKTNTAPYFYHKLKKVGFICKEWE